MKYFVRGWDNEISNVERILGEYNNYYKTIKNRISKSVEKALNQHDSHIIEGYFEENNYIIKLEEKIWGIAFIVFKNAIMKHNEKIKDDYWIYNELYLAEDKYEIHILFDKSEVVIVCDDVYIRIEEKDYWTNLYEKENYHFDLFDDTKENIIQTVVDKEITCGYDKLKNWEQLIYSFYVIYSHINYYKYNSIDEVVEHYPYHLSEAEKQDKYKALFTDLEERLIRNMKTLEKYSETIKEKELDEVINKFLEVYNKKNITEQEKNQLYKSLEKDVALNPKKIYKKILMYINENLMN